MVKIFSLIGLAIAVAPFSPMAAGFTFLVACGLVGFKVGCAMYGNE